LGPGIGDHLAEVGANVKILSGLLDSRAFDLFFSEGLRQITNHTPRRADVGFKTARIG